MRWVRVQGRRASRRRRRCRRPGESWRRTARARPRSRTPGQPSARAEQRGAAHIECRLSSPCRYSVDFFSKRSAPNSWRRRPCHSNYTCRPGTERRRSAQATSAVGPPTTGPGYASRAWDHLFAVKGLTGTIRVVLNDDTTIGTWAERSSRRAEGNPRAAATPRASRTSRPTSTSASSSASTHPYQPGQETDAAA